MREQTLTLIPATQVPLNKLIELINQAYADYYVPIWFDEVQFKRQCRDEDTDLEHSRVAKVGEELVGLALLAHRGDRGWINAVGVLPAWRRQGLARSLLQEIQAIVPTLGLRTLTLEVLEQNEPAIRLYQESGFFHRRELLVLTAEPPAVRFAFPPSISESAPEPLLATYDDFHDVPLPWQRERASLEHRQHDLKGLTMREDHRVIGYVFYQYQRNYLSIQDLAVSPAHPRRPDIAHLLLQALHVQNPGVGGYAINVPAEDPLLPAYLSLPYQIWHRQSEMVWPVT